MKRTIFIFCSILLINSCLLAQKYEPVTVKAGTSIKEYFPVASRYLYPNFTAGKGYFKKGVVIPCLFNFNVISGEMEFIQSKDTLIIAKKEEINSIVVAKDTFYYHDAYLQMIRSGRLSVYVKRSVEIKNILKQGAMGTINRSAASDSYSFVLLGPRSFDMKLADDVVIQQTAGYFYSTSGSDFIPFTRKNIIRIMQGKEDEIKNYIKANKIDFDSREDLLKLAGYVSDLIFKNSGKS